MKKHLNCEENCTHTKKVKRNMGKKKSPLVTKTMEAQGKIRTVNLTEKPKMIQSLPDDIITGSDNTVTVELNKDETLSTNSWMNIASTMVGIPSNVTKHKILEEIDRIFGAITLSDNVDAHTESVYIIDECLRKLTILKRDKEIA